MYNILTLNNNIKIINQKLTNTNAVSFGLWVKIGSRYEQQNLSGISHFIEHMLFKGTNTKNAKDIAIAIDDIGGRANAFTSKEYTCYHFTTIKSSLINGLNIFIDMFFNSKFDVNDIFTEKTVINEEISMYEDSPEDLVLESMLQNCFNKNNLGNSILGNKNSLENINDITINNYMKQNYIADNIIISLTGDFDNKHLEYIKLAFENIIKDKKQILDKAIYIPSLTIKNKQLEQAHICIGFNSIPINDNEKYSLNLLNNIIGGSMSSRLFQKVREEYGLCYHISSFNLSYSDVGIYNIYVALNKSTIDKAIKLILNIIKDICKLGCTMDELSRAKNQLKTNLLLNLESSDYYMKLVSTHSLYSTDIITIEKIIKNYDVVTIENIKNIAKRIFKLEDMSLSLVGEFTNIDESYSYYEKYKNSLFS